jgi:Tfp pilus assembly protein PilP
MKNRLALFGKLMAGVGICVMLLWLGGCKNAQIASGPETAKPPEKKTPTPTETQEGGTVQEKKVTWSYDPTGKRDPFLPAVGIEVGPVVPPLQQYNLDQMWIDGIFIGAGRDVAHVFLPDNSDWFIKVGDEIGVNRGRVKRVESEGIVVEEQYLDPVDPQKIRIVEKFLRMEPIGTSLPLLRK